MYFIENRGQVDERVAYYVHGRDTSVYLTTAGFTFVLSGEWAVQAAFVGASPDSEPRGVEPTAAVVSYFKGPRSQWQTGLTTYSRIVYPELWPGSICWSRERRTKSSQHFVSALERIPGKCAGPIAARAMSFCGPRAISR